MCRDLQVRFCTGEGGGEGGDEGGGEGEGAVASGRSGDGGADVLTTPSGASSAVLEMACTIGAAVARWPRQ